MDGKLHKEPIIKDHSCSLENIYGSPDDHDCSTAPDNQAPVVREFSEAIKVPKKAKKKQAGCATSKAEPIQLTFSPQKQDLTSAEEILAMAHSKAKGGKCGKLLTKTDLLLVQKSL